MMLHLLSLPHEVLHAILVNINPQDLARLCCCRALNDFIKSDCLLHKELYLNYFDAPPINSDVGEVSWDARLKRFVNFQKILESKDVRLKTAQLHNVTQCVQDLLTTAAVGSEPSQNIALLTHLFESQQNIDIFLTSSFLFDWARAEAWGNMATTRVRRDIRSTLTNLDSTRSSVEPLDLKAAGSAISVPQELRRTPLAHVSVDDSEAPTQVHRCQLEIPIQDASAYMPPRRSIDRQLSAKLHCLYGASIDRVRKDSVTSTRYSLRSDTALIHPYARSLVYDLRQHTFNTLWGPFLDDGSSDVDWEKMEAIMLILDHNVKFSTGEHHEFHGMIDVQTKPFLGATPNSFVSSPQSLPMQPRLPLEAQDPYAVTGTWRRVICFLDYAELYDFNFNEDEPEDDQPRRPIDTQEAIRLITMKIRITKIEPPGEEDGQALPVVHFHGNSHSLRPHWDPNAKSKMKGKNVNRVINKEATDVPYPGSVRLTPQGEVRWTTFSVYHGEERWRSEGIQVGGVRSARGVLGYWFDKDHDEQGPAGPTSFWKYHDGIEEKQPTGRDHPPMSQFTYSLY